MRTPRPATTSRTSDPASALTSARWADAPVRPAPARLAGGRGLAGAGVAAWAWLAEVMRAARLTARAASTVPWPVPGPSALSALSAAAAVLPGVAAVLPGVTAVPPGVTVLLVSAWVTWATVRWGNRDSRRAATPATMPLAALVLLTAE
jgi:hypothetical protein